MNIIGCIIGAAITVAAYLFLKNRRAGKDAELSGGFAHYMGLNLKEAELLRILVLEELDRYRQSGYVPVAKKSRKKRIILTAVYIPLNFLLLSVGYYKGGTVFWSTALALLYTYLYYRIDPIGEICAAVKNQPTRPISQIVREMVSEQPPKSMKPVGIVAFAVSLALFFSINAVDRFSFAPLDGGYNLEKYRPGVFSQHNEVVIPKTYQGEPVIAIGKRAFEGISFIHGVSIPETVTTIDSYAFKGCSRLEQITLPEGLKILNGESFKDCSKLREIVIPEGVVEIRGNTFENCTSLKNVELHDGIVDIHAYAFCNCKALEQIVLPPEITEIHAYTFENCESLLEIDIPIGVTRIAAHAFYGCSSLQSVFVPDTLREIGSSAFRLCSSLNEIALPKGVSIDERAFKESPTKLVKKLFTDEQIDQILEEASEKDAQTTYYVYKKDAPDVVRGWDSVTVLIVDDILFESLLEEDEALQAMHDYSEVLTYLEAAEQAGFTEVLYGIYSPIASEITGEPYFLSSNSTVEEMMEECRNGMAEEKND